MSYTLKTSTCNFEVIPIKSVISAKVGLGRELQNIRYEVRSRIVWGEYLCGVDSIIDSPLWLSFSAADDFIFKYRGITYDSINFSACGSTCGFYLAVSANRCGRKHEKDALSTSADNKLFELYGAEIEEFYHANVAEIQQQVLEDYKSAWREEVKLVKSGIEELAKIVGVR
jgi:hypothetical protein